MDSTELFTKEEKFEKKEIKPKFDIKRDSNEEISNIWNKNKIEELELSEIFGHGNESKVYKAQASKNKKLVKVKKIISKERQTKNYNEIRISNKLRLKNIINIYGVKEIIKDKIDSREMEYAKQGNLINFKDNLVKKSYLSESLLCYLTYQILCGLKYCHMNKVLHFDIKPQNIVIDDYLVAKIIDFLVALDYSKIKSKSIKLPYQGTCLYMAPEVIKNKTINVKDLNKVDLFSLGITLYYLAFNSFPFGLSHEDIKDNDKIYGKIMEGKKIKINDVYSKHFIDFLNQLLQKDINERIDINQALEHYWVKGAIILNNEKEKVCDDNNFLSYLILDHFKSFDDYLKKDIY